jgi:hypothetical protein
MLRHLALAGPALLAACGGDAAPRQSPRVVDSSVAPAATASVQDSGVPFRDENATFHRSRSGMSAAVLQTVSATAQPDFDRVVLEFAADSPPGYDVSYADRPLQECGSGDVVRVAGNARLLVRLEPARAHHDDGTPTATARLLAPALPVVREMKLICDFEGQVQWVLGLAEPRRYRVLEPPGRPRLVIDVHHE